jgi:ABC-type Fe3+ transport system permease subunit
MGMLAWVIMGLALWHFTIWLPDRFWGGIVGAFLASIAGAAVTGIAISLALHGVAIPGRHATHLGTVLYAIPGALAAMALIYAVGAARERSHERFAGGPFGH